MLRQATIAATRKDKPMRLTVLHNGDFDGEGGRGYVQIQVNGGQPVEVNADDLREAIADVMPRVAKSEPATADYSYLHDPARYFPGTNAQPKAKKEPV